MAETTKIREGNSPALPSISEIDILWITAGLGCDGDTIAMTAATQPSIEDIVLGSMPWTPKVHLHNPFLAIENGDDFLKHFYAAAEGKLAPFILVIEGSIPDESNKKEGYWASMGTDQKTGQPITTCDWIDRLAPKAWAVVAAGTCATYGGIHAMEGNPTGLFVVSASIAALMAIGISTSGGSRNIIVALEEARKRNLLTVALLGCDGGEIRRRQLADFPLVVQCDYIPRIQEVQASIYHIIRETLEVVTRDQA